jgi:hypothetical protein
MTTTRTNFTFRVDTWTPDGESVVEHVAGIEDYRGARAGRRTVQTLMRVRAALLTAVGEIMPASSSSPQPSPLRKWRHNCVWASDLRGARRDNLAEAFQRGFKPVINTPERNS